MYVPSDDTANGIIATLSTIIGSVIGATLAFIIDPENRWIVQMGVGVISSFVLFGLGKGIDIWLKFKFKK